MAKNKKSSGDSGPDPNAWMVTFGDLVTLMLTFFVLLLSMSSMDEQKLKIMSGDSSGELLKLIDETEQPTGRPFVITKINLLNRLRQEMAITARNLSKKAKVKIQKNGGYLDKNGEKFQQGKLDHEPEGTIDAGAIHLEIIGPTDGEALTIAAEDTGILVSLPDDLVLAPGGKALSRDAKDIIRSVAGIAKDFRMAVTVIGHTDDQKPSTSLFPSNWERSCAKAALASRFIQKTDLMPKDHLRVGGFADLHPIESNDTPEGRKANQRLDLWLEPQENWASSKVVSFPRLPDYKVMSKNEPKQIHLIPDDDAETATSDEVDPLKSVQEF